MDKSPLVSVIIPCYNAEKFIGDTLTSVLDQSFQSFEIIIVNDGSTDHSAQVISSFNDSRITCLQKKNTGVSDSRNKGFEKAKGDYVLFLDADDIIASDFLEKRVEFLNEHPDYGFCFSSVMKIDEAGKPLTCNKLEGAGKDPLNEILSYNLNFLTCPSNYLFRTAVLKKHQFKFDVELSSSADRYFLIELSRFTKGGKIRDGGFLAYRVHKNSMSNYLTLNLLHDNLKFQKKVLNLNYIPKDLRKIFSFKTNYIFAGSYYKLRKLKPFAFFFLKAFYNNPIALVKNITKN